MALLRKGAQDTASGTLKIGEGTFDVLSGVTGAVSYGGHLGAKAFHKLAEFIGGKSHRKKSPKSKRKSLKLKRIRKSPKIRGRNKKLDEIATNISKDVASNNDMEYFHKNKSYFKKYHDWIFD